MNVTVQAPPVFPPGTTLTLYPDPVGDVPPSGPSISTAVVAADSSVTFTGVEIRKTYQAGALVGGKWRGFLIPVQQPVGVLHAASSSSQPTPAPVSITDLDYDPATQAELDAEAAARAAVPGMRTRTAPQLVTASLANAAAETGAINLGGKSVRIMRVTVSRKARVRLYDSAADRDAAGEAARAISTYPTDGAGVVLDIEVDPAVGALVLQPQAFGSNFAGTDLYYRVTNTSGAAGTVTVTFDLQVVEV